MLEDRRRLTGLVDEGPGRDFGGLAVVVVEPDDVQGFVPLGGEEQVGVASFPSPLSNIDYVDSSTVYYDMHPRELCYHSMGRTTRFKINDLLCLSETTMWNVEVNDVMTCTVQV